MVLVILLSMSNDDWRIQIQIEPDGDQGAGFFERLTSTLATRLRSSRRRLPETAWPFLVTITRFSSTPRRKCRPSTRML